MSNSQRVYDTVLRSVLPNCPTQRITQARNLAWFITGLYVAAHCQLTRIAAHLPWEGDRDGIVQRLRHVLINPRLDVRTLYSQGWDLETSGLETPARFERLLLVMALAYVWLVQIVKRGWRHWVDRKARRTLSYFRLGWNWLNRMLARDQRLPCPVLGSQ